MHLLQPAHKGATQVSFMTSFLCFLSRSRRAWCSG